MKSDFVIRLNAMGDILLTIPALRKLAKDGHDVHLLVNSRWYELAQFLPAKVHFYSGANNILNLIKQMRSLNFDKIHDLQGKLSSIIIKHLIRKPFTTYKKRSFTEQTKALLGKYPLENAYSQPVWQRYCETVGVSTTNPDASLNIANAYIQECNSILNSFNLAGKEFIILHPGASKSGKEMPEKLVTYLINNSKRNI